MTTETDSQQVMSQQGLHGDDNVVELTRHSDGTLGIWVQNEDGEAADEFDREQFEAMVAAARALMGW